MFRKYCYEPEHVHLLSIGEEGKRHYTLIESFNTFMYGHTLHCGKKVYLVLL